MNDQMFAEKETLKHLFVLLGTGEIGQFLFILCIFIQFEPNYPFCTILHTLRIYTHITQFYRGMYVRYPGLFQFYSTDCEKVQ